MPYYSKSKYVLFCDCNKRLWCEKYKPEFKEDIINEGVIANGNLVGALARNYFPNTLFIDSPTNDLDYMVCETKKALDNGIETIAEASFFYKNNYCACDLLHKNSDGSYDIYEVKSTTKVVKHYYDDIAYQRYVLVNCGLIIKNTYLLHINSDYVFKDELNLLEYFKVEDLTEEVLAKQDEIEKNLALSDLILADSNSPQIDLNKMCDECPFNNYCFSEKGLKEDNPANLYKNPNKYKQIKQGLKTFNDLVSTNVKLSPIQKRQIDFYYNDCCDYFDKESILYFLKDIKYPIYFLDFESNQYAVPRFNGTKPFSQVCFQYSLHVLDENNNLTHYEFLADERKDYREDFVKQLIKDLKTSGSIIAYNKGFEVPRIKEMAQIFPKYSSYLLALVPRFIDIADVFRKGYYYTRKMGKSFSIKSVLPALFPQDPELDYHNLENVHNGSEAMFQFDNLINLDDKNRQIIRESLLEYCKLDTYAMVKIYQLLIEKIKEM